MRNILLIMLFVFGIFLKGNAQSLEIQGLGGIDCTDNMFHLNIQVRSADPSNINIGAFSIFFIFNENVMSYHAFNSQHFDGSDSCGGATNAWDVSKHGYKEGTFNMNFDLMEGEEANSCPTLNNNWIEIADIVFNVTDFPKTSDLSFVLAHSDFNSSISNDGTASIPITSNNIIINNCLGDYDNDGIADDVDNCPFVANPSQEDLNNNGIGDICEAGCDLQAYTGGDEIICPGDFITLAANGIGGTAPYEYEWSTGETTAFIATTQTTGTTSYYVTVTDSEGCLDKDTILVTASNMEILPGLVVINRDNWTAVDTIYDGETRNYMDMPLHYNLRALVAGDIESMTFSLSGKINHIRNDNTFKYDFLRTIPGAAGAYLMAGDYNMNMRAFSEDDTTGINCATRNISFTITSDCAIDLGIDTSFCEGQSKILDATSQGLAPFSYLWSTGENTATITATPTSTNTRYSVSVTDDNGCQITDEINIETYESGVIDHLVIIDLLTGIHYDTIQDGEIYLKDSLPTAYTIEALSTTITGSIDFSLTGDTIFDNIENSAPFQLFEDGVAIDFPVGAYTLEAVAYKGNNALNVSCSSETVSFTIVSCPEIEMEDEIIFCTALAGNSVEIITPIIIGNNGPYTYNWSDGSTADHITITQPMATSTYYLSVSNADSRCGITLDTITAYVSDVDITDLLIRNLDNNSLYASIEHGAVYNIQDLPINYKIEALTSGTVGSVELYLTDDLTQKDTINNAPYQFDKNNPSSQLPEGNYSITANIHSLSDADGPSCEEITKSFSIVDCASMPIAGTSYEQCESYSKSIPSATSWKSIRDENGHVIASFHTQGAVNLGTVSVDVNRSEHTGTTYFSDDGDLKVLPRHFRIQSANYAQGTSFPDSVKVRLYFTTEELRKFNTTDLGAGLSNYDKHDIILTHYSGDNLDCDYGNNTYAVSNYERPLLMAHDYSCDGYYIEFETNHFSEFILHEPYLTFPVEMLSFDARLIDNKKVLLNWETASEENVDGFEIERSNDAETWNKIGFVAANNIGSRYDFWDNAPLDGVNYYRLKIIDEDDSFEYSSIKSVLLSNENKNYLGEITPNPVNGRSFALAIHMQNETELSIQISNNLGQVLFSNERPINKGYTELSFNTAGYPNGFYWIQIIANGENSTRKFEVIR